MSREDGAEVIECEGVVGFDFECPFEQLFSGVEVEASEFRVAVVAEQVGVVWCLCDGGFEVSIAVGVVVSSAGNDGHQVVGFDVFGLIVEDGVKVRGCGGESSLVEGFASGGESSRGGLFAWRDVGAVSGLPGLIRLSDDGTSGIGSIEGIGWIGDGLFATGPCGQSELGSEVGAEDGRPASGERQQHQEDPGRAHGTVHRRHPGEGGVGGAVWSDDR